MDSSSAQETVNQRLNILVDSFERGKKVAFARKVSISPQAAQEILAGRQSEPSFKVLVRILENYPQVCSDWLVLGRGPMLRGDVAEPIQQIVPSISAEQVEAVVKETIITQLGLDPAVRREADEATRRAEQIAKLELSILDLRMKTEALNHEAMSIRNGYTDYSYVERQQRLLSINSRLEELHEELNGKFQMVSELRNEDRLDRPDKQGRAVVFGDLHWAGGHRWKMPTGVKALPSHWQPTKSKRIHTSAPDANALNLRLTRLLTAVQSVFTAAEAAGKPEADVTQEDILAAVAAVGAGKQRQT
nr:hypothetical protein [Tanacetum cinerariifolium]